jgi:alkylation response protein AidB-like acyl-CoA dehydrogenase
MRSIGAAELALEMMVERSIERKAFGKQLNQHGTIRDWIARSRIEIDQARLLVRRTAWMIDKVGAKAARKEISMIKALVPGLYTTVCDRAMQVFGAMGISPTRRWPIIGHGGGLSASRTALTRCTWIRWHGSRSRQAPNARGPKIALVTWVTSIAMATAFAAR